MIQVTRRAAERGFLAFAGKWPAQSPVTPEQRQELDALHEDYLERVNEAIEQDREDLAWALADAYHAEVLRITADERPGD